MFYTVDTVANRWAETNAVQTKLRDEFVAGLRALMPVHGLAFRHEPLAHHQNFDFGFEDDGQFYHVFVCFVESMVLPIEDWFSLITVKHFSMDGRPGEGFDKYDILSLSDLPLRDGRVLAAMAVDAAVVHRARGFERLRFAESAAEMRSILSGGWATAGVAVEGEYDYEIVDRSTFVDVDDVDDDSLPFIDRDVAFDRD